MYLKIQINDATYASLLNGTSRVRGSIGLVNPTEGNFNAHRKCSRKREGQFLKLPHGKVSIDDEKVKMNLCIVRTESIVPSSAIKCESLLAGDYIEFMEGIE